MTQSFDEWFTTYRPSLDTSAIEAEFIYESGAQSKQAEIDELQHKVKCEREISLFADKLCVDLQSQVDELRKRIDDAIERSNHAHIGYQMLYKQFDDVMKILKGTTNEQ